MKRIDWEVLKENFRFTKLLLRPFVLPTKDEHEGHKALIGLGRGRDALVPKAYDWGDRDYPGSRARIDRILAFNEDLQTGGAVPNSAFPVRSCFAVVSEAIERKQISTEFILAWGYLDMLAGRYVELLVDDDARRDSWRQLKAGTSQDQTGQRCWYAHWMIAHGATTSSRNMIQDNLAELCAEIWRGERESAGFDPAWFKNMIMEEDDGEKPRKGKPRGRIPRKGRRRAAYLTTSLGQIPLTDLVVMTTHRFITKAMLPPLSEAAFSVLTPKGSKDPS